MSEINLLKDNLEKYPNIKTLINEKDIDKWTKKLAGYTNPINDYILNSKFNILTSLILENTNDFAKNLAIFFETSLKIFPQLLDSDTFKRNIKSLDDFAFISFLSELTLSKYLKGFDFNISFNSDYQKIKKGDIISKDIDIVAKHNNGQNINFEIYTPNSESDINGFFDLPALGEKFEKKIKVKEYDKFEGMISGQLNGKVLLAINYAYDDNFNIYLTASNSKFFIKMEDYIHHEIDGILLFHHDIAKDKSLHICRLIIKQPLTMANKA